MHVTAVHNPLKGLSNRRATPASCENGAFIGECGSWTGGADAAGSAGEDDPATGTDTGTGNPL